ncbi:MAG TPA: alkaline phosphatase family protein [Candidatus Acidoferrales bacterium]|nr:alkaline phosphatase family protein [Candidatus Acidoferrales bacterium]
MSLKHVASHTLYCLRIGLASLALFQFAVGASLANAAPQQGPSKGGSNDGNTASPIKHVIVIIGENRSYDHVFATYVPQNGQTTKNLLSEGIVNADGTPGPNFSKAEQLAATATNPDVFLLDPPKESFPGNVLPAPLVGGSETATGAPAISYIPNNSIPLAKASENGLPTPYYSSLVTGGTLLPHKTPDTRIAGVSNTVPYYSTLMPGPFQLTGPTFPYISYAASPVHRFYQMWQQENCSLEHWSWDNPSGCNAKLFSWVEVTEGAGSNGNAPAANFSTEYSPAAKTTGEGSTALGFYNMQQGDVPYFKSLADTYAISDNFHQSVDGGTGANHIMFGHADAIFFYDPTQANPFMPPHNPGGGLDEVENPKPQAGTNNWYTEDGYGGGSYGYPAYGGGSYSNCSDPTQNGVADVVRYLHSINIDPRCEPGHYYLLNNYNPGYFGQGENAYTDTTPFNTIFTIPPSSTPSIGDNMIAHHVSWKYYGDQWNDYAGVGTPNQPLCAPPTLVANCFIPEDKYQINYGPAGSENQLFDGTLITYADEYCNICNPFQYDSSIMADPAVRTKHIQDTLNLYSDIQNGTLPAVSIVKPSGLTDGHPASSKLDLFEGFTKKIVDMVHNSPYWQDTVIFITEDEGGGYYDSGYVQPLDFFGDGTRIIFLAVSPYTRGGRVAHDYADHVSIIKFIERNWNLPPITYRSRDNFPNPKAEWFNPYVPTNSPAISDLFELFNFDGPGDNH